MSEFSTMGGCVCGKIRYEISAAPVLSVLCFCDDCLRSFGCDGYPGMMIKEDNFSSTGNTKSYSRSSNSKRTVIRNFCPHCGTNVWGQTELGLVSVGAGTLDNPGLFKPDRAVFTSSAPDWARIPTDIPNE